MKFYFDESCHNAFEEFKSRLVEAPIMAKPNWNREFEIMCDACDFAMGAVFETQVGKMALNMPNQSKGTFPSDTQKNPKDCMAIQLRSGKDLSSNKRTERKEETEGEKEETEKEGEKNTYIEQPKGSNDQKKKEGVPTYTPLVPFP